MVTARCTFALKNTAAAAAAFLIKTHSTRTTRIKLLFDDDDETMEPNEGEDAQNNFIKMSVGGDCEQTAFNRVYSFLNKLI